MQNQSEPFDLRITTLNILPDIVQTGHEGAISALVSVCVKKTRSNEEMIFGGDDGLGSWTSCIATTRKLAPVLLFDSWGSR